METQHDTRARRASYQQVSSTLQNSVTKGLTLQSKAKQSKAESTELIFSSTVTTSVYFLL